MNKPVFQISLVLPLALVMGCSKTEDKPTSPLPAPTKTDEVKRPELLVPPTEDVRKDARTAKDFPSLKITQDAASKPTGEEALGMWDTGVFHFVYKLSTGKEIKNTYKTSTEELTLVDGGGPRGVVFGCLGMKKGEIRNLFIPADLGYGEDGDLASGVGPNATLLVRAELVELGADPDPNFLIRRTKAGTGDPIRVGQSGQFRYTGVLADGANEGLVFDSNIKEGAPPLPVTVGPNAGVIDGWKIGLLGMKKGERRWLKIPPHLAYGEAGSGDKIGPNATLIFEVELADISSGNPMGMPQGMPQGLPQGIPPQPNIGR